MSIALKRNPFYGWILYFRFNKGLTTAENLCWNVNSLYVRANNLLTDIPYSL